MRIGMMTDLFKPHVSGITNYIDLNKQFLEAAGHEVSIFTFGDPVYEEKNVFYSPGMPVPETGYYLNFRFSRRAKTALQTMDLVHVHHPFLSGRLALRYCRPLHIPVVFTNHTRYDLYARAYLPLLPDEISNSFLQTYMPSFCAGVDLTISPSQGMARVLRELGVTSRIEIIPNGVDLQRYLCACEDCRSIFGFNENDILLVYSGRLAPEKNLDFLINAFAATAEAIPETHLLLIGDGPEKEKLQLCSSQTSVNNRIHFLGRVPYQDMPRYLSMCDIFVTASLTEVHPLSVIEAMAAGLPALGIHSVGVGDTIEDEATGLLSRNDPAAFSVKMTLLCLNKNLRKRFGESARKASKKYTIEKTTEIILGHYEQLVFETRTQHRGIRFRFRTLLERYRK